MRMPIVSLLLFVMATPCLGKARLADDYVAVTSCIFHAMTDEPGVSKVDIYALEKGNPLIEYFWRDKTGKTQSTDIYISGPNVDGHYQYVGDFMDIESNPLADMTKILANKCKADGYWNDQVIVTNSSQRVEARTLISPPR